MRLFVRNLLFVVIGAMVVLPMIGMAATSALATVPALTPQGVQAVFDAYFGLIMLVIGLVYTRLPALKAYPNSAVPWVNLLTYMLGKIAVPEAHASPLGAVGHFGGLLWVTARGAATSVITSLLYDKFFKAPLDKLVPKAIVKPGPLAPA